MSTENVAILFTDIVGSTELSLKWGNRENSEPVGLRVGLSVGEASNESGDYFGDTVVAAARLCAHCDSGQILATDFVQVMAGRRNRHECRSNDELTVKGLPDPIETVEVA